MKKISLIIPVYNVERYLRHCLDSVLENRYPDLEILCIDDGSTDDSGRILEEYKKKDSRFRIIHQENRGVSAARNVGLEAAKGELIGFVDADDWIHSRYLSVLVEYLERYQADLVVCGYDTAVCRDDITKIRVVRSRNTMKDHTAKCFVWGRIYRREILEGIRFREDMALGEDRAFHLALVCKQPELRVARLNAQLYGYRQRPGSAVAGATEDSWLRLAADLLEGCRREKTDLGKGLYLTESLKVAFSVRNQCREDPERVRQAEELVAGCIAQMKKIRRLSPVRRCVYLLMARYAHIYRVLLWMKEKGAGSS